MAAKIDSSKKSDVINNIMQTLQCNGKESAKLLIHNALQTMNYNSVLDVEAFLELIQTIIPNDPVETILAIQYIALHIKGMNIMAENNNNTLGQGLTMLRLSHQALNTLQQYRGKSQNINVNYNVHSQGDTVLNTMIKGSHQEKEE